MMQFQQCMQLYMDSAMQEPVDEIVCILNLTAKQLCSLIWVNVEIHLQVQHIYMAGNNLTGYPPASWGNFSEVPHLD